MSLDPARAVADAVLYEGYLLYPYRATSTKNQVRWQFGVLGPPARPPTASARRRHGDAVPAARPAQPATPGHGPPALPAAPGARPGAYDGGFVDLPELDVDGSAGSAGTRRSSVERACPRPPVELAAAGSGDRRGDDPGGRTSKPSVTRRARSPGGWLRQRGRGDAELRRAGPVDGLCGLTVEVANSAAAARRDKDDAIRRSLIGAHLIVEAAPASSCRCSIRPTAPRRPRRGAGSTDAGPCSRAGRVDGRGAGLADHPVRLPGDRRGERRRAVRLHRDRRDPHPAGDDDDRRGEGRGPGHRSAGGGDHRPLRGHGPADLQRLHGVLRDPHAAAAPRPRNADRRRRMPGSTPATCPGGTRPRTSGSSRRWTP